MVCIFSSMDGGREERPVNWKFRVTNVFVMFDETENEVGENDVTVSVP